MRYKNLPLLVYNSRYVVALTLIPAFKVSIYVSAHAR